MNFADIALPLRDLLKKRNKSRWSDKCQNAFEEIKKVLWTEPVWKAPDLDQRFVLNADASDQGIGVI